MRFFSSDTGVFSCYFAVFLLRTMWRYVYMCVRFRLSWTFLLFCWRFFCFFSNRKLEHKHIIKLNLLEGFVLHLIKMHKIVLVIKQNKVCVNYLIKSDNLKFIWSTCMDVYFALCRFAFIFLLCWLSWFVEISLSFFCC